jgi:hypothetical protein
VQHQRRADPGAQVLRIARNREEHLGGQVEQQSVKRVLVLVREVGDGRGEREHHVVILDRQQVGLAGIEPALGRGALALGAVAVAAGVVGDLIGPAALAAQHVSTQCRTAALLDGRHDLQLRQAQVPTQGIAPRWRVLAEDVGDLQGRPAHGRHLRTVAMPPAG